MMRFDPTLQVKRLQVCRGDLIAYDEEFHAGINVIRGENSSGKSTVLNALFYGLGGDQTRWSDAAKLCSHINVEVEVNGLPATLSREISSKSGRPMDIYGGRLDDAVSAPRAEWRRFPYSRVGERESFSQSLFGVLGIPEAANDQYGNITIHQLLRLMYSDQLSPIEELFRGESFDSATTRENVGRLLCGAFDAELYDNELRIRDLTRDFEAQSAELRSLLAVLGRSDQTLTTDWLVAERANLISRKNELVASAQQAQKEVALGETSELTLDRRGALYERLSDLQEALSNREIERDQLVVESADSERFIQSLEYKYEALADAALAADAVGDVRYSHCPACHAEIAQRTADVCHLCSGPIDPKKAQDRIVAIRNDLAIQLRQSRQIQEDRKKLLAEADAGAAETRAEWQQVAAEFNTARRQPTNDAQVRLGAINRELGYVDKALEDLVVKERLVSEIERLRSAKDEIRQSLSALQSRNEVLRAEQMSRLSDSYTAIADECLWFISHDLKREEAFDRPRQVDFSFSKNNIKVDGQDYFSASSRVVLKNAFASGFLFAALNNSFMNHFRLLLLDTIEDKGMEPVRSQNFQNLLRDRSEASDVDHQIIFATSMISPDLDDDRFTVGHFATRDNPTLAIGVLGV